MIKRCFIYGLSDPRDPSRMLYIGKANDIDLRVRKHIWAAKNNKIQNTLLSRWLCSLIERSETPIVTMLKETTYTDWKHEEISFISHWRQINPLLLNIASGGNGPCFNSDETRRRMSAAHTGLRHTEKTRKAISDGQKGNKRGEKTREKLSAHAKRRGTGHMNTASALAKKSKSLLGRTFSDSHKAAIARSCIGRVPWNKGISGYVLNRVTK